MLRALLQRHQGGIPNGDFWPGNFSPWIDGRPVAGVSMQTVIGLVRRGLLEQSRIGYRLTDAGIEVAQELEGDAS